jgi:hypothetical protein
MLDNYDYFSNSDPEYDRRYWINFCCKGFSKTLKNLLNN